MNVTVTCTNCGSEIEIASVISARSADMRDCSSPGRQRSNSRSGMRAMRSNIRARNVATIFWPLNAVR